LEAAEQQKRTGAKREIIPDAKWVKPPQVHLRQGLVGGVVFGFLGFQHKRQGGTHGIKAPVSLKGTRGKVGKKRGKGATSQKQKLVDRDGDKARKGGGEAYLRWVGGHRENMGARGICLVKGMKNNITKKKSQGESLGRFQKKPKTKGAIRKGRCVWVLGKNCEAAFIWQRPSARG